MAVTKQTQRKRKAPVAAKRKPSKRRVKKGILSDIMSPAAAKGGIKAVASGMAGGAVYEVLNKLMSNKVTGIQKDLLAAAIGYGAATIMNVPNVGAGIAGAAMSRLMEEQGILNDMFTETAYVDESVANLPMVMNDNMELQDGMDLQAGMDLQDSPYDNRMTMLNAGISMPVGPTRPSYATGYPGGQNWGI